ncbi:MAG: endonuclease III domain-containing protein [Acidobacteria bacterium]|nr:endonuclease III domain-containing protein [Acidobacteriota bacterium]
MCDRYCANETTVASQPHPAATPERAPLRSNSFREYYEALFAAHGPQHWWPGRTSFEVIVGAILVQNTSWTNVEPAIERLRREKLLTPRAIECVSLPRLEKLIHSSGYFRQKAKKLKAFVKFLRDEYQGSIAKMARAETQTLRPQLLAIHGIGPETADSILLYAVGHPVFVVDAYARRILERHGHQLHFVRDGKSRPLNYEEIRQLFERELPRDPRLYNEFHALIVQTGKRYCRPKNPICGGCPLKTFLPNEIAGPTSLTEAPSTISPSSTSLTSSNSSASVPA